MQWLQLLHQRPPRSWRLDQKTDLRIPRIRTHSYTDKENDTRFQRSQEGRRRCRMDRTDIQKSEKVRYEITWHHKTIILLLKRLQELAMKMFISFDKTVHKAQFVIRCCSGLRSFIHLDATGLLHFCPCWPPKEIPIAPDSSLTVQPNIQRCAYN